jgi:hypothetical protein
MKTLVKIADTKIIRSPTKTLGISSNGILEPKKPILQITGVFRNSVSEPWRGWGSTSINKK